MLQRHIIYTAEVQGRVHAAACENELDIANPFGSLTFDNQDGWGGQALHIRVNDADVFPPVVQLDIPNHQIPRNTLEDENMTVGEEKKHEAI